MANARIVKDSLLAIFVKQVQAAPAGTDPAAVPALNTFVNIGGKVGVLGDTPRKGEDGAYYTTVDTAALLQFDGVTGTWIDGAAVYVSSTGKITSTSTDTLIGYADRPKSNTAAGLLYVQLVPRAL